MQTISDCSNVLATKSATKRFLLTGQEMLFFLLLMTGSCLMIADLSLGLCDWGLIHSILCCQDHSNVISDHAKPQ